MSKPPVLRQLASTAARWLPRPVNRTRIVVLIPVPVASLRWWLASVQVRFRLLVIASVLKLSFFEFLLFLLLLLPLSLPWAHILLYHLILLVLREVPQLIWIIISLVSAVGLQPLGVSQRVDRVI